MTDEQAQPRGPQEDPTDAAAAYDMEVDTRIQDLSDAQLRYLSPTIRELIVRRIEGIHYAEGRRSQLMLIGGALAAVGVALLPLGTSSDVTSVRWACTSFSLLSIFVGASTWFVFVRQTNYRYPFIDAAQTWKWFYHYALPDKNQFKGTLCSVLARRAPRSEKDAYRAQWERFRGQVEGLSDPRIDATQDLKQLYLLHVDERYKNRFLSQLRDTLKWGVLGIVLIPLVVFFGIVVSDGSTDSGRISHAGILIESSWLPTGSVRSHGISERDLQFKLVLKVTNHNETIYVADRLVAEDADGTPIFAEFDLPQEGLLVEAGQTSTLVGHFWIGANDRSDLVRIDAE